MAAGPRPRSQKRVRFGHLACAEIGTLWRSRMVEMSGILPQPLAITRCPLPSPENPQPGCPPPMAGMGGIAVVIQAMGWMGMTPPPMWQLIGYMLCIGMYGVGVGMLYTPLLVDRMQLTFPSGLAVANILRALTDPVLLRRSVARLAGGTGLGVLASIGATRVVWLGAIDLSASTFGAGMIVGARIGIAALVGGLASWALTPYFVSIGWLAPGDPYRKITFLIALGMIMGAAAVDVSLLLMRAAQRTRAIASGGRAPQRWIVAWVAVWGAAVVATGVAWFGQPVGYQLMAVALVLIFALVNGI